MEDDAALAWQFHQLELQAAESSLAEEWARTAAVSAAAEAEEVEAAAAAWAAALAVEDSAGGAAGLADGEWIAAGDETANASYDWPGAEGSGAADVSDDWAAVMATVAQMEESEAAAAAVARAKAIAAAAQVEETEAAVETRAQARAQARAPDESGTFDFVHGSPLEDSGSTFQAH